MEDYRLILPQTTIGKSPNSKEDLTCNPRSPPSPKGENMGREISECREREGEMYRRRIRKPRAKESIPDFKIGVPDGVPNAVSREFE